MRSRVCLHDSGGSDGGRKDYLASLWMDVGQPAWTDGNVLYVSRLVAGHSRMAAINILYC